MRSSLRLRTKLVSKSLHIFKIKTPGKCGHDIVQVHRGKQGKDLPNQVRIFQSPEIVEKKMESSRSMVKK